MRSVRAGPGPVIPVRTLGPSTYDIGAIVAVLAVVAVLVGAPWVGRVDHEVLSSGTLEPVGVDRIQEPQLATTVDAFRYLWSSSGHRLPTPPVDLARSVVLFVPYQDGGCGVWFDTVRTAAPGVDVRFEVPTSDHPCIAGSPAGMLVLAVDRGRLTPEGLAVCVVYDHGWFDDRIGFDARLRPFRAPLLIDPRLQP